LTAISRKFGIKAIFLMVEADRQLVVEETHKFYASLGPNIKQRNPDNSSRANN
jgi:hypothetical protein